MGRSPIAVSFLGACRAINSVAGGHPEIARAARSELWHLPQDEGAFREHLGIVRGEVEEEAFNLIDRVLEIVGVSETSTMQEWEIGHLVYQYLRTLQIGYPRNPQWDDQPLLTNLSAQASEEEISSPE